MVVLARLDDLHHLGDQGQFLLGIDGEVQGLGVDGDALSPLVDGVQVPGQGEVGEVQFRTVLGDTLLLLLELDIGLGGPQQLEGIADIIILVVLLWLELYCPLQVLGCLHDILPVDLLAGFEVALTHPNLHL